MACEVSVGLRIYLNCMPISRLPLLAFLYGSCRDLFITGKAILGGMLFTPYHFGFHLQFNSLASGVLSVFLNGLCLLLQYQSNVTVPALPFHLKSSTVCIIPEVIFP